MVRFSSLPGDLLDSLCGDFITEDLGQVLASVCGGELAGIKSLIENEDTNKWVRGAALSGLVTLVAAGQKSRDEMVNYFTGLFRGKLVRKRSYVWDALVASSCDLHPEELLDDIERACEEGLVDPGYIRFDDVKRDLALGKNWMLARLADNPHRRLPSAPRMSPLTCFTRWGHSENRGLQADRSGRRSTPYFPASNCE